VQFDTENAERFEVEIYNIQGLNIYSNDFEDGNTQVNISVPAGIYFIKMKNDIGRTAVQKMIVQN